MIVHVTINDIQQGIRRHAEKCPVALAMQRETGKDVHVTDAMAVIDDSQFMLPLVARLFINDFDGHCAPGPFTFELPYSGFTAL